jgi:hypothetical protein
MSTIQSLHLEQCRADFEKPFIFLFSERQSSAYGYRFAEWEFGARSSADGERTGWPAMGRAFRWLWYSHHAAIMWPEMQRCRRCMIQPCLSSLCGGTAGDEAILGIEHWPIDVGHADQVDG